MVNLEVIRAARNLAKRLQESPLIAELQLAESELLNDLRAEELRAELQIVEARLLLFDYKDQEEKKRLTSQKESLQEELNQLPVYRRYQMARSKVDRLTKKIVNTISQALKEEGEGERIPSSDELPETIELMLAMARSPEMHTLRAMQKAILTDDQVQRWLSEAMSLHEKIRNRQFADFRQAEQIQEQIVKIEQKLADHPIYQEYQLARRQVDRLANAVLEILSFQLTGEEFEGGCVKNQHPGPAGVIVCEECGKTSIPLRTSQQET